MTGILEVVVPGSYESWQHAARDLVQRGVAPDEVRWVEDPATDAPHAGRQSADKDSKFVVPRRFVELARAAAAHPSPARWATMYRVLWRLVHENRRLLESSDDSDVRALVALQPSPPVMSHFELELSPPVSTDAVR